ncbi:MAG: site-specific integrase [Planctomycetes bacterium]|nr:site-specific integrase [Planctomycetota bacterium]
MEAKKTPALYQKRDGKWYCTLWGRQRYPWLKKRDRLIFILMLHAGLRRIEAAHLTWPDIDLHRASWWSGGVFSISPRAIASMRRRNKWRVRRSTEAPQMADGQFPLDRQFALDGPAP